MSKVAKLIIRDEVNVKFEGLDVITRRKISDKLKFFLPYAYHLPAYKLGRWDGNIRFCDIGGRTYLNLLDRILPIIEDQDYEIDIEDNRDVHEFKFEKIDESLHLKNMGSQTFQADKLTVLRDYSQKQLISF